jgi:hypothetical protein
MITKLAMVSDFCIYRALYTRKFSRIIWYFYGCSYIRFHGIMAPALYLRPLTYHEIW